MWYILLFALVDFASAYMSSTLVGSVGDHLCNGGVWDTSKMEYESGDTLYTSQECADYCSNWIYTSGSYNPGDTIRHYATNRVLGTDRKCFCHYPEFTTNNHCEIQSNQDGNTYYDILYIDTTVICTHGEICTEVQATFEDNAGTVKGTGLNPMALTVSGQNGESSPSFIFGVWASPFLKLVRTDLNGVMRETRYIYWDDYQINNIASLTKGIWDDYTAQDANRFTVDGHTECQPAHYCVRDFITTADPCTSSTSPLSESCTYGVVCTEGGGGSGTLVMSDSYGDGWNGNYITITSDGTDYIYGNYGSLHYFSSGSSATVNNIPLGQTVSISIFGDGGWSYEISWVLKGCNGEQIISGDDDSCSPSCNNINTNCGGPLTCTSGSICPVGSIAYNDHCYPGSRFSIQSITKTAVGYYCNGYAYLDDPGSPNYPPRLPLGHPLHSSSSTEECAMRCLADTTSGNGGFYLQNNNLCGCTSINNYDCLGRSSGPGYDTYRLILDVPTVGVVEPILSNLIGYEQLGTGKCDPIKYLPEGAFPIHLTNSNFLKDSDRILECAKRCLHDETSGNGGFTIQYPGSSNRCACTTIDNNDCSESEYASGYKTYKMVYSLEPLVNCNSGYGGLPCEKCVTGQFSSDASKPQICAECPNGWYQNEESQSLCKRCPSNSVPKSDKTACQCNNGFELDGSVCKECTPGKTSWGGEQCDSCPQGYYMDEYGAENCKYCLAGQYQNEESQSSCKSCPSGQYQEYEGESSCDNCESGKEPNADQSGCVVVCGANEEANAEGTACQCMPGYEVERTIVENLDHQYCNDDRRTIHLESSYAQDTSLTSKEAVIAKCHTACYNYPGFTTSLNGGSVTADSCTCRQYIPANCPGTVTTWGPPSLPGMASDSSGGYVFKLEHVDVCVSNSCTDSTNVLTEDCPYVKNVIAPMEMVMYGWMGANTYSCSGKYTDWAWNGGWAIEFEGTRFIHNSYSWSTTQDFPLVTEGRITAISITPGHTWSGRKLCARWTLRCTADTDQIIASGCDGSSCGGYSSIPGTVSAEPWDFTNDCPGGGDQIFTCGVGGLFYNGECTEPCDAGYYMDTECKVCPRGFYQNEAAKSACTECPGGFHQEGYGQTECKSCSSGQFSSGGSFEGCESCVEGQYQDQAGQGDCDVCPNGWFSTADKTDCLEGCPPGQFVQTIEPYPGMCTNIQHWTTEQPTMGPGPPDLSSLQTASVQDCYVKMRSRSHTYLAYDNNKICSTGTTCDSKQASDWLLTYHFPSPTDSLDSGPCVDCPAGKFSIDQGCQDCSDGTYQDETGQVACKLGCDSGKYLVQNSVASGLSLVTEEQIGSPFFCKYFGFHTVVPDSKQQNWYRDLSIYTSSVRNSMAVGLANGNGEIPASGIGSQNNIDGWGGTSCASSPQYCTCYAKCKNVEGVKHIATIDKGNVNWVWTTECYCMTGDRHSECRQGDANTDNVNVYDIEATVHYSCSICPIGYSKSSIGADPCTLCESGKYQDEVGQTSCGYCMAGKSVNSDGTGCDCPEGQISDALDSECYDCLPGRFYVDYSCQECPAGYSKSSDDDSCNLCGVYEFQDDVGQSSCKNCNVGFISSEDRTQCTYCPAEDTDYNGNWVTGCGPWATVDGCSCVCGNSGFSGEHCDVCGKGMGWNATSQKCLPCIYPYVNDQTSHDAVCSQDYCPPGQGTTQDKNAWAADNTTENCVWCTGSTVSPDYYGQCVSVVCNGRLVPKSSIDHTLEAIDEKNCMECEEGKVEHQQTCVDPVCVNGKPKSVIDQSLEYDDPANCLSCDTHTYMFMDSCIIGSSCGPGTGEPAPVEFQYDLNHVRFLGNLIIGVEGSRTLVVYKEDTRVDIVLDDSIIDVEIFDDKIAIILSSSESSSVAFYDVDENPFTLHVSMLNGQPMEIVCTVPCKDIEVDTNLYVGYSLKVEEYNIGLGKVKEHVMRGSSISVGNNVIAGSDDDRLNLYTPGCPSCSNWLGSDIGYMNSVRKDGAHVAWAYDYDDQTLLRTYNLGTRKELYLRIDRIDVMYWLGNNLLVGSANGLIMYDENLDVVKSMSNDPVSSISGFTEESGVIGDWRSVENIITNGLSSGLPSITRYRFACEMCESPFVNDGSSLSCAKIVCSDTSYSYKVSGVDVSLAYDNDANCEPCSGIHSGDPCQPIECDTGSLIKSAVDMVMNHTLPHDDQNNCFQCAETQVVRLNSCVDIQCNVGQKINRVGDYEPNDQRNCEDCTGFEVGNGYTCIPIDCGTRTRKNSIDHTLDYKDTSNCGDQCGGGTILNVADKTQCVECTGNTVPNNEHTECIDVECDTGYEASITDRSLDYNDQRNCVEKDECANNPCSGKCTDLLDTYVCHDDIIMGHGIADFAHKNIHICPHGFVLSYYKSSIVSEVTDSRGEFKCPNFISYGETVVFENEIFSITGDPLITEANFINNICEYPYRKVAKNMETFVIGTHNAQADDGFVYIYCPHRCPHIKCKTDETCVKGVCEKHTCTANSKVVGGCVCFGQTCSDWCMDNGECVDVLEGGDTLNPSALQTAFE